MKQMQMLKNGEWVEYDGTDNVSQILITETVTLEQLRKYHPDLYKKFKKCSTK